ncbi:MAG: endonuclease domain-containing protein [Lysobacter sp.]
MQGQTSHKIIEGQLQRKLRNTPTDAEQRLWQHLKGRQLLDCKFRRQHPYGNFVVDFVCLERKLIVELDGSQHADTVVYDALRTELLQHAGFHVLRFWNNEVFDSIESVLEVIWLELQRRANPSPPNPPLEGEG